MTERSGYSAHQRGVTKMQVTLEDFILAYDPGDCGTIVRLGADPGLLQSSLLWRLRKIISEREDEDDERITS
jgi:hypothetical protein